MVAKKAAYEPKDLVICIIRVSNLPAMSDRLRHAGKRCPDVSRRIVSITLRSRQDRRLQSVETAKLIQLAAGGSPDPLESHQRVRSLCHPNERIRRETRPCEQEQDGN